MIAGAVGTFVVIGCALVMSMRSAAVGAFCMFVRACIGRGPVFLALIASEIWDAAWVYCKVFVCSQESWGC